MMTANEARSLRKAPYTLDEAEAHIKMVATDRSFTFFDKDCVHPEVIEELKKRGFAVEDAVTQKSWRISW